MVTPVTVYPGAPEPTHDISLSVDEETIGLIYSQGVQMLQEIPISEPSRPFTISQKSWHGGRGRLRYQDDPTGFYDNQTLWSMTEGKVFQSPLWRFAKGIRSADTYLPDATYGVTWKKLIGTQYISNSFSASASYSADDIYLWIRRVGTPATLTVRLASNSAGDPGSTLKEVTLTTIGSSSDPCPPAEYTRFHFSSSQSLTVSTTYHVYLFSSSTDNENNHWEVGVNDSVSGSKTSTNGSTWTSASYSMYYRVTDAISKRKWYFFFLENGLYACAKYRDFTSSVLYMNGDRFKATAATSTTLTDSGSGIGSAWATDKWAGARVRSYAGGADGESQQIISNTNTVLTTGTWEGNTGTSTQATIYSTDWWTAVGSTGLGKVVGQPEVAAQKVYFPQGGSNNIRRMAVDYTQANYHNFADDGTNKATHLKAFVDTNGVTMWKTVARQNTVTSANVPSTWTNLTFSTTAKSVGESDYNITNFHTADALYIFKEDSLWRLENGVPRRVRVNFEQMIDPNNGQTAANSNGAIWTSWGDSVVRVIGSEVSDMLNYRAGSIGIPDNRMGTISCILSVLGWIFVAIQSSRYSSIMAWNGFGWLELFRGADTMRITSMFWQSNPDARPRLWFDYEGDLCYFEFPFRNSNPTLDEGFLYQNEGVLITQTFDANEPTLYKLFHSFRLVTENLGSTRTIYLDWQKNEEIGTSQWHNAGSMTNTEMQEFVLDIGECYEIRFRLRLQTTAPLSPSVIKSYSLTGWVASPLKYQWVANFRVGINYTTKNGLDDFKPDDVVNFLRGAFEKNKKVRMRSLKSTMDDKVVTLSAPVVITDSLTDEGWRGRVSVAMREA